MVRPRLMVALAALLSYVHGHYTFMRLAVNGKWHEPLQYVRNKTADYWEESTPGGYSNRPRTYDWWTAPSDRPESMRCGRDNMAWAKQTEVLSVTTGDQIEFAHITLQPNMWTDVMFNNCPDGRGTCKDLMDYPYFHQGAVVVHISKVPDGGDVKTYDGSGKWIKIYTLGLEIRKDEDLPVLWLPRNYHESYMPGAAPGRIIFTLPKETPKGQYLLRAASVWHASNWTYYNQDTGKSVTNRNEGQLYHSCAHINVESDATGSLPKGVLIPEVFQYDQPGMLVSQEMASDRKVDEGYTYPGGPLWNGKELIEDKPSL